MQKKKILLLSDHPLSTSGVGTQARFLINGLLNTGKYTFRCFGAAQRHESLETTVVNPDLIIKPVNGFGTKEMLRHALITERPDAIVLFTDPRFFIWVWEMEDEIHQVCPIAYNHLWDNGPWPEFNRVLYESTDLLNCINYPTYEMLAKNGFANKANYVPHAVPADLYYPLKSDQALKCREMLLGKDRLDHFVVLWVGRNARRKMPGDILASWRMFLDELEAKHGHRKATLVMHTEPLDPEGPNLHHVVELYGLRDNVVFSKDRMEFPQMNMLYNSVDCSVNRSCAEGFGLPILEQLYAGRPVIALKTGGLSRQVVNHKTGETYGVALEPEVKALVGTQLVPYIYDDYVSHETVAKAFMTMHEMGPERRAELGAKAREYVTDEYSMKRMIDSWDESLTKLVNTWKSSHEKWEATEL